MEEKSNTDALLVVAPDTRLLWLRALRCYRDSPGDERKEWPLSLLFVEVVEFSALRATLHELRRDSLLRGAHEVLVDDAGLAGASGSSFATGYALRLLHLPEGLCVQSWRHWCQSVPQNKYRQFWRLEKSVLLESLDTMGLVTPLLDLMPWQEEAWPQGAEHRQALECFLMEQRLRLALA